MVAWHAAVLVIRECRERLDEASGQDGRRWRWTRHRSQIGHLSRVDARSRLAAAEMLQELPRAGWLPLAA